METVKMTAEQLATAILSGTVPVVHSELVSDTPTYTIAPLPWVCVREAGHPDDEWWESTCPISERGLAVWGNGKRYAWYLGGVWQASCSSVADGKVQAETWFRERLLPALRPVEG